MTEVNMCAIVYPRPGKVDRLRELMVEHCKEILAKEDYTLRFLVTEKKDAEAPEIWLFETFASAEAADKHATEPHFKTISAKFEEEQLMVKPPYVSRTVTVAGFDIDKKIVNP